MKWRNIKSDIFQNSLVKSQKFILQWTSIYNYELETQSKVTQNIIWFQDLSRLVWDVAKCLSCHGEQQYGFDQGGQQTGSGGNWGGDDGRGKGGLGGNGGVYYRILNAVKTQSKYWWIAKWKLCQSKVIFVDVVYFSLLIRIFVNIKAEGE